MKFNWIRTIFLSILALTFISIFASCSAKYDLIVVGSDPEGIAAAVSAARQGVNTLLVSSRDKVGGLMTVGGLNTIDMNYGPRGELLTKGIFLEYFNQIEGDSFDTTTAENVFQKMLQEAKVVSIFSAKNIKPLKTGNKVTGISFFLAGKEVQAFAPTVIDATQDGDIAHLAGVDFTNGMEDFGGPTGGMGATMIFALKDVSWEEMSAAIRRANKPHTGASAVSVWGFWDEMQGYEPRDPHIRFRGLNIGRQNDGTILINSMYIFNFDHLSKEGRMEARRRGIEELKYLVPYMQANILGFENASLSHVSEELYIRETRHMVGLYRLTVDDVLEHRNFDDKIALGSYPIDIQDLSINQRGYVVATPKIYSIPFRCLVPKSVQGILVVGRAASFDSLAHGSARVIPVGMAVGEAAGLAVSLQKKYPPIAWQSLAENSDFIADLQDGLRQQGAYLPEFDVPYPLADHWVYPALKKIRRLGLLSAGYNNDYKLEEPISGLALQNIFNAALARKFADRFPYYYSHTTANIFAADAAQMFLYPLGYQGHENPLEKALSLNLFPADLPPSVNIEEQIDRGTLYFILAHYLDHLAEMLPVENNH